MSNGKWRLTSAPGEPIEFEVLLPEGHADQDMFEIMDEIASMILPHLEELADDIPLVDLNVLPAGLAEFLEAHCGD